MKMKTSSLPAFLATMAFASMSNAFVNPTTLTTRQSTRLFEEKTATEQRRQPWNVLRFVQQSSKFVPTPFSSPNDATTVQKGDVIWQPSSKQFQWAPLDDVVMGGVSVSTFDNASGLWKGKVTDANNGGFVGIRSTPVLQLDLSSCNGLEFTFQASPNMPKRLKVVLRDSRDFNGIAWSISVNVPATAGSNKQVKIKVPLTKTSLTPTRFAQIIKDSSVFNKSGVTALQLVYSKFEYEGALNPKFQLGDFDLQLLQVQAY